MAQNTVDVTALVSRAGSGLVSADQVIVFDQTGNTDRMPFADAVDQANVNNNCVCIKEASLTIATADVLTLNGTPIEIVAAPGAGYAIEVLSASMKMVYNSTTYATNTRLELIVSGGSVVSQILFSSAVLSSAADVFSGLGSVQQASSNMLDNAALNVQVQSGNPTAGDSDIKIYVTYRIITL